MGLTTGASYLNTPSSQLSQVLDHIHGTPEVCMYASQECLCFKSSRGLEGANPTRKEMSINASLVTEMSMAASDFETFTFATQGEGGEEDDMEEVSSI